MKRISRALLLLTLLGSLFAQEPITILKSAILPGWGELSYKSNSAYIFIGTEAALWLGYAGLRYSGYIQNQDLISYTQLHAGISDYPADVQYWSDLGNFMSYDDHREEMLENRTPGDIWSTDYDWEWNSEDDLLEYGALFRKKELTLLGSEFVITGMIVNRIASMINVRYLHQKNMQLSAFAGPVTGGGYVGIGLSF